MAVMARAKPRVFVVRSWTLPLLCLAAAAAGVLQARAQPDGFISIDCGLRGPSYVDDTTQIPYDPDDAFTDAGENREIPPSAIERPLPNALRDLRSFPNGTRNCYLLRSLTAGNKYLIRATFMYGYYDSKERLPVFDLYIDVNFWTTVEVPDTEPVSYEAIVLVPDDFVQVCLVKTGAGTPFISMLDLRPLKSSLYPQVNGTRGLNLMARHNFGTQDIVRYPDDTYDRIWFTNKVFTEDKWTVIATDKRVNNVLKVDMFEVPSKVMQTAVTPTNASESIQFQWSSGIVRPAFDKIQFQTQGESPGYMHVLYFSELESLPDPNNAQREFYVIINGKIRNKGLSPQYLLPNAIYNLDPVRSYTGYINVTINATANSTFPPIINAFELFTIMPTTNVSTESQDVSAIMAIKMNYRVKKNWMGDPCFPDDFKWTGLTCSPTNDSVPGRITGLNMSFSRLNGDISSTFADLKAVQYINLSHNNLTGSIPDTLSQLPSLTILDLTGNQLNGSIPPGLLKKIQDGSLNLIGGFGYVYSGFLEDGTQVAVKLRSETSNQGVKEFATEAQILTRIHHKNLVSMIGYCRDGEYMALVYEYMAEGTLQDHLTGKKLTWRRRLRIALESAQGLEYLHRGCSPPLIHRDVKTSNILLNVKLEAKVADFGLSKAFSGGSFTHISTNTLVGTLGYIDPEYQATMQPTTKSDVFSFGVVLLELVTGKPAILRDPDPINVIQWARLRLARGEIESIVDERMSGGYDINGIWKVADIALKCTAQASTQRPTMTEVVVQLQECLELEEGRAGGGASQSFYDSTGDLSSNYNINAYTSGASL